MPLIRQSSYNTPTNGLKRPRTNRWPLQMHKFTPTLKLIVSSKIQLAFRAELEFPALNSMFNNMEQQQPQYRQHYMSLTLYHHAGPLISLDGY